MSVPAALGRPGVTGVPELPLEASELAALRASAGQTREQIAALEAARLR
jgi:malate/lactate dehydrogenase